MSRPTHPFNVRSRDVLAIALPASLAFITEPLAGLVDMTIVGRLGDASLLGGLALGSLVFDVVFSLAYFLRMGTAGLTAQSVGARDEQAGLLHVLRALGLAVAIGVALVALSPLILWLARLTLAPGPGVRQALDAYCYVRILSAPFSLMNYALLGWFYGRAEARTGMLLQMLLYAVDILASVLFVYGFGWGVPGVAWGTVLGQAAAALTGLALLVRHHGGFAHLLAGLRSSSFFDRPALRRLLAINRDLMIRSLALMAAYSWFAAQGSRMGEVTLGANAILLNFLMVASYFLDGLAQAAEQLVGRAIGANWRPAFDAAWRLCMRWGLTVALVLAGLWLLAGTVLVDFMTTSEPVRSMARQYLWLAAPTALTGMPAFVFDGMLVGATLNVPMRNGMLVALAVFLAAAVVLQKLVGNTGLWLAMHAFFVARAAVYWRALESRRVGLFTASCA